MQLCITNYINFTRQQYIRIIYILNGKRISKGKNINFHIGMII